MTKIAVGDFVVRLPNHGGWANHSLGTKPLRVIWLLSGRDEIKIAGSGVVWDLAYFRLATSEEISKCAFAVGDYVTRDDGFGDSITKTQGRIIGVDDTLRLSFVKDKNPSMYEEYYRHATLLEYRAFIVQEDAEVIAETKKLYLSIARVEKLYLAIARVDHCVPGIENKEESKEVSKMTEDKKSDGTLYWNLLKGNGPYLKLSSVGVEVDKLGRYAYTDGTMLGSSTNMICRFYPETMTTDPASPMVSAASAAEAAEVVAEQARSEVKDLMSGKVRKARAVTAAALVGGTCMSLVAMWVPILTAKVQKVTPVTVQAPEAPEAPEDDLFKIEPASIEEF